MMSQSLQITQEKLTEARVRVLEGENAFLRDQLIQAVATATELSGMLNEREHDTPEPDHADD